MLQVPDLGLALPLIAGEQQLPLLQSHKITCLQGSLPATDLTAAGMIYTVLRDTHHFIILIHFLLSLQLLFSLLSAKAHGAKCFHSRQLSILQQ